MSSPGTYAFEILNDVTGQVCCASSSDPYLVGRCEHCKGKTVNAHRALRAAGTGEFEPPDPYKSGLDAMRRGLPVTVEPPKPPCPFDTPGYDGKSGVPPDPYSAGLARMKTENKK